MKAAPILFCVLAGAGCRSTPAAQPNTPRMARADTPAIRVRMVSEPIVTQTDDAAVRAFTPDVQPVDSAGECRLFRTGGSGATTTTAYFPSFDSARTSVTLTFDSAGHLVRFSDRRGLVRFRGVPGMSPAQFDSVRRAAVDAERATTINFDYAVDQAFASNSGGGRPARAVTSTVRAMENLEQLGPPTKRIQRVRRLCGV
ncbi:MAG TPA: hypothetical protein VFT29_11695 [Gemmatimonadaceae bacterium]|nr:hypothetical protein [Gemmatimonadaceae bacterium]